MAEVRKTKLPKGLPKRTRNDRAKATRARSWASNRDPETGRKFTHINNENAQRQREQANDRLRSVGMPTPWQVARAERRNRRAQAAERRKAA